MCRGCSASWTRLRRARATAWWTRSRSTRARLRATLASREGTSTTSTTASVRCCLGRLWLLRGAAAPGVTRRTRGWSHFLPYVPRRPAAFADRFPYRTPIQVRCRAGSASAGGAGGAGLCGQGARARRALLPPPAAARGSPSRPATCLLVPLAGPVLVLGGHPPRRLGHRMRRAQRGRGAARGPGPAALVAAAGTLKRPRQNRGGHGRRLRRRVLLCACTLGGPLPCAPMPLLQACISACGQFREQHEAGAKTMHRWAAPGTTPDGKARPPAIRGPAGGGGRNAGHASEQRGLCSPHADARASLCHTQHIAHYCCCRRGCNLTLAPPACLRHRPHHVRTASGARTFVTWPTAEPLEPARPPQGAGGDPRMPNSSR